MSKTPIIVNFKTGEETEVKAILTPRGEDPEDAEGDYCVASWNHTGSKIYKGNNRSIVTIIDSVSLRVSLCRFFF